MSDPNEEDARLGTTLGGKWRLDRLLGIGGMARVYAASHRNGALAAIKVLNPELARSSDARSRFMREAYIANKVGLGAVRVLDDDVDDDGAPYLVMELLSGEPVDVRAAPTDNRLPLRDVLWIARETLATLESAHAHGIIHRDLKPGNLFWTTDDALKMLDFGIARVLATNAERTVAGTVFGTLGFMAHEQALGLAAEIDARTDLWAVGAIMWNLITGRDVHPPSGMNELIAAATAHAASIATVDDSLPPEVVRVVDRALMFEREARYPSARAMREDIVRIIGEGPIRASPPARISRPGASKVEPSAATAYPEPDEHAPAVSDPPQGGFATGMSDDDTLSLRRLFELIELSLLSRKELEARGGEQWLTAARLGGFRKLENAFQHATAALDVAHIGLFWNVLPEGFATRQGLLWVAEAPLAPTPKGMFAAGVRMLGLLPGLLLEEFGEIVRLIRGDLAPFADYATFLQSSQLPHLVYRIDPTKPGMPEHPSLSIDSTSSGRADVPGLLAALSTGEPALRAALLRRLERVGDGHEDGIARLLPTAEVPLAIGLLRVLQALGNAPGRAAARSAIESPFAIVRIEALIVAMDDGAQLDREIASLLTTEEPSDRLTGLVLLETYKVVAAAPQLATRIKSASFDALPVPERRQALTTLGALLPARAETVSVALLDDRRVMSTEAHETTRELACEALGHFGSSRDAREALFRASQGRVKTSERVWTAATLGLEAFDARRTGQP